MKKNKMMIVPLAVAALAFTAASAPAQTSGSSANQNGAQHSATGQTGTSNVGPSSAASNYGNGPKAFMKKAAEGGVAEVDLGRLAEQKAANPSVKDFGQRMVKDHSNINDKLKTVASKENVQLPQQLNSQDSAIRDRLEKETGKKFDQDYMKVMVSNHKQDVADFEQAANSSNQGVKQFAEANLPTLRDHLKEAKKIEGNL